MSGKKVTIVGMGRTALALTRLLLQQGARPFVTDSADQQKLGEFCRELDALGVPYECGGHTHAAFEGAALVIPSPGVPPGLPAIVHAQERGCAVLGEMEYAYRHCRSRIMAVTGTNGKTTTTELLHTLVEACGHSVLLAGNNAVPFSAAVLVEPAPEIIVLEVSSYQLETSVSFRPWIAAVLNVTPDHLVRHGALQAYAGIKAKIFENQRVGDHAVVNDDDPLVKGMAEGRQATVWRMSLERQMDAGLWVKGDDICFGDSAVAAVKDTLLPGRHNLQNVLAALTMMRAGGFDWEQTLAGLRGFRGVEHRIEFVAQIGGVDFYNDSKSTNIDSLKVALESFEAPVVLLAGGRGKGADYRVLRPLVQQRVKALIVFGEDAPLLRAAFDDVVPMISAPTMSEAVHDAISLAKTGDVVLLSPACASFDMFTDFENRGRVFKDCVRAHVEQASV